MPAIMVVDDQKLMCDGLRTILESREGYRVAATAGDGEEALALLEACPADLVLLDIRMPKLDGVRTVRLIKQRFPQIKVVMLTTFDDEDYILDALAGGADGYLLKDIEAGELFRMIDNALAGGIVMPPQVADGLRRGLMAVQERRAVEKRLQELGLTPREQEIAKLLCEGFTNTQIASALYLSEGTARNYVSLIYEKLGVKDRANAVIAINRLKE